MIADNLEALGLVDFEAARNTITAFFDAVGSGLRAGSDADLAATDLMYLTAAEIALPLELYETNDVPFYLVVPSWAARTALFSSDCGPFKTHDPREEPKLWDVTLLGSDASKLFWSAGTDSVAALARDFIPAVTHLADMYQDLDYRRPDHGEDDPTRWSRQVFAIRVMLWRAKISVLLGETKVDRNLLEVYRAVSGEAIGDSLPT